MNSLTLWCFNCNYTVSNCNTVEDVILRESEDNYCTIGFIGETIVFRVSIKYLIPLTYSAMQKNSFFDHL